MAALRTDSLLSRRIVSAFLDFLKSVEFAPGADLEAIEVVKECLREVFSLRSALADVAAKPGLLAEMFALQEPSGKAEAQNNKDQVGDPNASAGEISKDDMYEKFHCALDEMNFFSTLPNGDEDTELLAKATHLFNEAYTEIANSGKQVYLRDLAEFFKLKGNQSVHMGLYSEAIGLYTCAIALCETNAVYYCNRAAAYMHIERYSEAIEDCLKSIEIDPNYAKAYRRLGRAYYAEGKYIEALNEGFHKALLLNPDDETVKEEIRVTQQKLSEQIYQAELDWAMESSHDQASTGIIGGHANVPPDLADIFNSVISAAAHAHWANERTPNGRAEERNGPEINLGPDVRVEFGEMPEELSGVLRSVMQMFISQPGPQGDGPTGGDQN